MANQYKGEARIEIENVVYTLVFKSNTIVAIEGVLGMGFPWIASQMQQPEKISYTIVRAMLWAALQDKHKEITIEQAGDMVFAGGGIIEVYPRLLEAFALAFPEKKAGADSANPPQPSQLVGIG